MCIFGSTPKPTAPKLPAERAAMRAPDGGEVNDSVSRRVTDRIRAGTDTILTSGSGVTTGAATQGKTLLGA